MGIKFLWKEEGYLLQEKLAFFSKDATMGIEKGKEENLKDQNKGRCDERFPRGERGRFITKERSRL